MSEDGFGSASKRDHRRGRNPFIEGGEYRIVSDCQLREVAISGLLCQQSFVPWYSVLRRLCQD